MRGVILALLLTAGCRPYIDAEMALAEQARRGVAMAAEAQAEHAQVAEELHALRRKSLDAAFDADVRERGELSADWVIEHRKAYAAALDGLAEARRASQSADESRRRTLEATDAALRRLVWLMEVQLMMVPKP